MPPIHPDRGPTAAARLKRALELLTQRSDDIPTQGATLSELCRLAAVSRNSVYRHHPTILAALRAHQRSAPDDPTQSETVSSVAPDPALLQEQLAKLAALVDHYYAAYRETRAMLDRRDREVADLRRKLDCTPVLLHR
jgi:AcrR family transcriptional regulator